MKSETPDKDGLIINPIKKSYIEERMSSFLGVEHNWIEIGEKPWTDEKFLYELPHKWELSFCAEDMKADRKIIGYIIGSCPDESCSLSRVNKVVVESGYRGLGAGGMLLERYLQACVDLGIALSELKVMPTNEPALRLYGRVGYEKVGEARGDDGKLRFVFQKKIGGGILI